jgi:serine/threonine-protein kinase
VNLSPEPDQQHFCDGITEDIMRALSRIPGIKVIGRTSVFAVKSLANDVREVGATLGAGMVVEGSVRKVGNHLKISTQMVDSEVGHIRWSESFDCVIGDVFAIQEDIALAIARILQVKLTPRQPGGLTDGAPDIEAYVLYLRGRQVWNSMSLEGCRTAIGYYDRAVSLFPTYASPYAGLADAYSYLALWSGVRPRDVFPKVKHAALEALRINPDLAHAHSSLAIATLFHDWSLLESTALAKKATELEPCYGFGQHAYGTCLLAAAQHQEAVRCFERAVQLNPLSLRVNRALAWAFYLQRRYRDAENWLKVAIALSEHSIDARYLLAHVYLREGRPHDALNEALQCQEDPPNPLALGVLGACLAQVNRKDDAERVIKKLREMSAVGYVDPYSIGQVYLGLEDFSQALESVRHSLEERTPFAVFLSLDPTFDALRSDPGFSTLTLNYFPAQNSVLRPGEAGFPRSMKDS